EYEIRIKKLEQNNKENINLKDEVMKLKNDIEEIKKKDQIIINTQNILFTEDISSKNLKRKHISNEIRKRNREKLRSQDPILKPSNLSYNNQNLKKAESRDCVSSEQNTDTQEIKKSEIDIQPLIQELFLETLKENCIKIVNIEYSIDDSPTIKL
ncbi:30543_t:CDS:2, partial [Racocetra persica]